ncbi:MAG: hypothetical protein GY847_38645 [Proteobacteria bacterium]|nr:hypothetical protein [Pseudomonadota bacterium]
MKAGFSKSVFKLVLFFWIIMVASGCQQDGSGEDTNDTDIEAASDIDTEINTKYNGVDLLLVVDNSGSMEQEQGILATSVYTLINSLVNPIKDPDWPFQPIENMRVAMVSSDLGLQYGPDHSTKGFPYGDTVVTSCTDDDPKGDDGRFQDDMPPSIDIETGQINCETDGGQCPSSKWNCIDGKCISPSQDKKPVNCLETTSDSLWTETSVENRNSDLARQIACMSKLGTNGCGKEAQLEAAVVALSKDSQKSFIKEDHLLVVLIVSDEEDCSIKDKGLFETDQWQSGTRISDAEGSGMLNVACNLPKSNEDNFLFGTNRYWAELIRMKESNASGVIFGAIVGVPIGDGNTKSPCQGRGNEISGCLDDPRMELEVKVMKTKEGQEFKHFAPACEREQDDEVVTNARPGRRYVKVAEAYGSSGYVYSICNADWSPAMKELAEMIAIRMN